MFDQQLCGTILIGFLLQIQEIAHLDVWWIIILGVSFGYNDSVNCLLLLLMIYYSYNSVIEDGPFYS